MILNIRHVGIVVSNLENSIAFYKDLLGFEIISNTLEPSLFIDKLLGISNSRLTTVKMRLPEGHILELLHFQSHQDPDIQIKDLVSVGITHFALTVIDIELLYTKLINHGVEFINPPEKSPNGRAKVAFCIDPEGNYIEIVQEVNNKK